jgi:hypothetical protein
MFGTQPVFSSEQLKVGQSFKVEVVDSGSHGYFRIGVATAELRNKEGAYNHNGSLCIYGFNGVLSSDGRQKNHEFQLETGNVV